LFYIKDPGIFEIEQQPLAPPPFLLPLFPLCRRRLPPLTTTAALLAPPSASGSSHASPPGQPPPYFLSSGLLPRAPRHPASARALPGCHLAAVVASACAYPPPFFSGPRPSVASPPPILLSLAFSFHLELLNAVAARILPWRTPCPPWADHPSPS
jgi:hypothetical protein